MLAVLFTTCALFKRKARRNEPLFQLNICKQKTEMFDFSFLKSIIVL